MKKFAIALIVLSTFACSVPALAFIETVMLPETAETGQAVNVWVLGGMPDSCWVLQGVNNSLDGFVATVDITTYYDNPSGAGCLAVVTPYEVFHDLVFPEAGEWTVRIVEHAVRPGFPTGEYLWEGTVIVTGETADEPASWESVKAIYR